MKYSSKIIFYLYVLLIFLLSLIPRETVEFIQIFGWDKIAHLTEYFILGFLYRWYIIKEISIFRFQTYFILLIPLIDEFFIQSFSNRSVDPWDFIFNIIGLLLGILIRDYFDKKTHN